MSTQNLVIKKIQQAHSDKWTTDIRTVSISNSSLIILSYFIIEQIFYPTPSVHTFVRNKKNSVTIVYK